MCFHTIRPLHFDYVWFDLTIPVALDFGTGREVRGAVEPAVECSSLVTVRYPHSVRVFPHASRDDSWGALASASLPYGTDSAFALRVSPLFSLRNSAPSSVLSNKFLECVFPLLWCLPTPCMLCIIFATGSFHLVHLLMYVRSSIFYHSCRSGTVRLVLHGSRRTLGSLEISRLIMWLGQPPDCLSLCIVGFLWLTSILLLTKTLGPGVAPYGLTRVHCLVVVIMLIELPSKPPDHGLRVTCLRTAHICNGTHFTRMEWDMDVSECPILSEGRPRFFRFLAERFSGRPP